MKHLLKSLMLGLSLVALSCLVGVGPSFGEEDNNNQPTFFQKLKRTLQKNTNNQSSQGTAKKSSRKAETATKPGNGQDQPTFFQKLKRRLQTNTNNQGGQETARKAKKEQGDDKAKSDGAKVLDKAKGKMQKMSDNFQKSIDRDKKNLLESGN